MNWLPPLPDFRERLRAARALADANERFTKLAALAQSRLGFVEEIQLDRALSENVPAADEFLPVRIALLSSNTIDQLLPPIRIAALRRGLRAELFAGRFGQYRQELLDPSSPLHEFRPEFIVLSLTARDLLSRIPLDADVAVAEQAIGAWIDELRHLWAGARDSFKASPVQQSFLDLAPSIFGNIDCLVPGSPHRITARLNERISQAATADGVLFLDVTRAAARDGIDAWFDVRHWLQGKMEIAPAAGSRYGELLARLVAAQLGRSRKCLVLDLDNTLWGGVVGDDGLEGLVLGEGSARGEAYLAIQRYVLTLKERGIVLAVCSKNESKVAESVFRDHPEMVLRRSDLAAFVANWDDKATNLQRIADELNIGLDSLVFVDDNPAERERIRGALPSVAVPELPADPADYVRCIADAGYFEAITFTAEDRQRAAHYAANAERSMLQEATHSVEEFLRHLAMTVVAGPVRAVDTARSVQLINKTNQFNMTTRRVTADDLARFASAPGNLALQFRLRDRFGDNGIVSVMLLTAAGADAWHIENWVMSCRVFGRQLEDEVLNIAVETAVGRGIRSLIAEFIPTAKNGVVCDLYRRLGFTCVERGSDDRSRWALQLADYKPRPTHISRAGINA